MRHVLLIGFMGAGKSTVGRLVARRLGMPFVDLDKTIAAEAGRSISDIFAAEGEAGFREAESRAVRSLEHLPSPTVVACGGGVVVSDENRTLLKRLGTVVYLEVSAEEALARVGNGSGRPMLAGRGGEMTTALLHSREALYEAVADLRVCTAGRSVDEVVEMVLEGLGEIRR